MELRHIRYFLAVAEELNFTRAAQKLLIAQPPLSRQIQALEEELGVQLFIRNPRSLQLTEEGILFRQQARQILSLVDKSTEEIREMKNGLGGTLYIASVEGYAPRLIAHWIAGFQKIYPRVQYNIWNGNSDDVIDRLMNGLCDLALIVEPYNAEGLYALPVFQESWTAFIPVDHPLALEPGDTVELQKLSTEELIVPSRRSRIREIMTWFDDSNLPRPTIRCEMAHMMNACALTEEGVGIAIFPASAAILSPTKNIVSKEIVQPSFHATYTMTWNKNHQLSKLADTFLNHVKENLQS
ncbi:MAG: LysR family transcriptional regulator [Lachnospiraceae bacterium]|nr:LysR family transcriptional regulator [Lachnospiraceae bacterium]